MADESQTVDQRIEAGSSPVDQFETLFRFYRRALCKGRVGPNPPLDVRLAAERAARLAAMAEMRASDVSAKPVDIVALDHRAATAKAALDRLLENHRRAATPPSPTLGDLLRADATATASLVAGAVRG